MPWRLYIDVQLYGAHNVPLESQGSWMPYRQTWPRRILAESLRRSAKHGDVSRWVCEHFRR